MGDPEASLGLNTGKGMNRLNNIQATRPRFSGGVERNRGASLRYLGSTDRGKDWERRHGSLSGFIVPEKSRRTGPPGAGE